MEEVYTKVMHFLTDPSNRKTIGYSALNIISSVSIVMVNKQIFQTYEFQFGTFLTFIHFIFTFLGCLLALQFKVFEFKKLGYKQVIIVSAFFCGFVVFTNLSLTKNSVGFYQVAKIMTAPTLVAINWFAFDIKVSNKILITLIPILLGVGISTVTDFSLNLIGFIYAAIGVIVTSLWQLWVKKSHDELQCNSMQLLLFQAPTAAVMLIFIIPLLDDVSALVQFEVTFPLVFYICVSAILAFFVNFSIFLLIDHTSALSYNVIGHFKSCNIIVLGFILFSSRVSVQNVIGIVLALGGIFYYTHLKLEEGKQAKEKERAEVVDDDPEIAIQAEGGKGEDVAEMASFSNNPSDLIVSPEIGSGKVAAFSAAGLMDDSSDSDVE